MSQSPSDEPDSKLVITRDGSHTVYSSQFDQHYHNPNGAIAESKYVFFEQTGLLDALNYKDEITILELGFGTGLNLMLLLDFYRQQESKSRINYYTVEGFPLSKEVANNLNYDQHLSDPAIPKQVTTLFGKLKKGMNHFRLNNAVCVHLFNGLFADFPNENIGTQFIFHDAFSPDVNPDLWSGDVFKKISSLSTADAILSTYCAASKAQGALSWAGWKVAKAQGALGKREMILAALHPNKLGDRKRINEERYAYRYEEGDFD